MQKKKIRKLSSPRDNKSIGKPGFSYEQIGNPDSPHRRTKKTNLSCEKTKKPSSLHMCIKQLNSSHRKTEKPSSPQTSSVKWQNLVTATILSLMTSFGGFIHVPKASATSDCDDVQFIFARGSGSELGATNYQAWQTSIVTEMRGLKVKYSFYELGSQPQDGYQYPAVTVGGSVEGYLNMVTTYFSAGKAFAFGKSVDQGINELKAYIKNVNATCSDTKFVLGGYSQGAMVITKTLPYLNSNKIIYAATFGDPVLYLPEGKPNDLIPILKPEACYGKNLSSYRAYVPDCRAYEGILTGQNPYIPDASFAGKVGAWCNDNDIMCSSHYNPWDHAAYKSKGLYADAAGRIRQRIILTYFDQIIQKPTTLASGKQDVVFLFDATGSMQKTIDKYNDEAINLAKSVLDNGGRISLYQYKDIRFEGPAEQICGFNCTKDWFVGGIGQIEPFGGGDSYESLLAGLKTILEDDSLDWREDSTKSIIVLSDSYFHDPEKNDEKTTVNDIVQQCIIDGVHIYIINTEFFLGFPGFVDLASGTGGGLFDVDKHISYTTDVILSRPVAKLNLPLYAAGADDELYLDASASYSVWNEQLTYEWDLDGDGIYEKTGNAVETPKFNDVVGKTVSVKVTDKYGSSTTASQVISKDQLPNRQHTAIQTLATVENKARSNDESGDDETAVLEFTTDASHVLLSIDDAVMGFAEYEAGSGKITIDGLTQGATITLTPFSEEGDRGESRSITIARSTNDGDGNETGDGEDGDETEGGKDSETGKDDDKEGEGDEGGDDKTPEQGSNGNGDGETPEGEEDKNPEGGNSQGSNNQGSNGQGSQSGQGNNTGNQGASQTPQHTPGGSSTSGNSSLLPSGSGTLGGNLGLGTMENNNSQLPAIGTITINPLVISKPANDETVTIPKVPNTGYKSAKLKR